MHAMPTIDDLRSMAHELTHEELKVLCGDNALPREGSYAVGVDWPCPDCDLFWRLFEYSHHSVQSVPYAVPPPLPTRAALEFSIRGIEKHLQQHQSATAAQQ